LSATERERQREQAREREKHTYTQTHNVTDTDTQKQRAREREREGGGGRERERRCGPGATMRTAQGMGLTFSKWIISCLVDFSICHIESPALIPYIPQLQL
jgi:hypothetical protein